MYQITFEDIVKRLIAMKVNSMLNLQDFKGYKTITVEHIDRYTMEFIIVYEEGTEGSTIDYEQGKEERYSLTRVRGLITRDSEIEILSII